MNPDKFKWKPWEKPTIENGVCKPACLSKKWTSMKRTYSKVWCAGICTKCGTGCAEHHEDAYEQGLLLCRYRKALEQIADPRKRDHTEPDAYTELGCVMNIANEALND